MPVPAAARAVSASWASHCACLDSDPKLFFPIAPSWSALEQIGQAKPPVRCLVPIDCLGYALVTGQDAGLGRHQVEERRELWAVRTGTPDTATSPGCVTRRHPAARASAQELGLSVRAGSQVELAEVVGVGARSARTCSCTPTGSPTPPRNGNGGTASPAKRSPGNSSYAGRARRMRPAWYIPTASAGQPAQTARNRHFHAPEPPSGACLSRMRLATHVQFLGGPRPQ
jgi:hypothetical protein